MPRLFVEETVCLAGRNLEVNVFRAEGFPFVMGCALAFFPAVVIAEERNGRRKINLLAQDVDLGILVIPGGKSRIEPELSDNTRVDTLRISLIVEAGVQRSEGADVALKSIRRISTTSPAPTKKCLMN